MPSFLSRSAALPRSAAIRFLSICLLGLCMGTCAPESAAQSMWGTPFDSPEEQENEEASPYGTWSTPQQDETRNGWTTDDPWNTRDPWGLEQEDGSWGESDWARDFYDFEDENGGGESGSDEWSAERVGDGIAMTAVGNVGCTSNAACGSQDCCIVGNNSECRNNCPGGGQSDNGALGNDEFIDENGNVVCTDPTGDCTNPDITVPLPGLVYLLLAGLGYGGYKLREEAAAA